MGLELTNDECFNSSEFSTKNHILIESKVPMDHITLIALSLYINPYIISNYYLFY